MGVTYKRIFSLQRLSLPILLCSHLDRIRLRIRRQLAIHLDTGDSVPVVDLLIVPLPHLLNQQPINPSLVKNNMRLM
jgi:hypothetical protein